MRAWRWASIALAVASCIAFVAVWQARDLGMDFSAYWRVSGQPARVAYELRETLNFAYLPTMLLWVSPLWLIPEWLAFWLWTALGALALGAATAKQLGRWPAALVLFSPPAFYGFVVGQVSAVVAAGLLVACTTDRDWLRGALMAACLSIKPQLALMAPFYLLLCRDWRALGAFAATLFVLSLLATAVFGLSSWSLWSVAVEHFKMVVPRNGVLAVAATPLGVADLRGINRPLVFLLCVPLAAMSLFTCRQQVPVARMGGIAAASLILSPYALLYDLVALAPFAAWLICRGNISAVLVFTMGFSPLPLLIAIGNLAFPVVRGWWPKQVGPPSTR